MPVLRKFLEGLAFCGLALHQEPLGELAYTANSGGPKSLEKRTHGRRGEIRVSFTQFRFSSKTVGGSPASLAGNCRRLETGEDSCREGFGAAAGFCRGRARCWDVALRVSLPGRRFLQA